MQIAVIIIDGNMQAGDAQAMTVHFLFYNSREVLKHETRHQWCSAMMLFFPPQQQRWSKGKSGNALLELLIEPNPKNQAELHQNRDMEAAGIQPPRAASGAELCCITTRDGRRQSFF